MNSYRQTRPEKHNPHHEVHIELEYQTNNDDNDTDHWHEATCVRDLDDR